MCNASSGVVETTAPLMVPSLANLGGNFASNSAGVAVNPVTNKIYFALADGTGGVVEIDGATGIGTTRATGMAFQALAVNAFTGFIYAATANAGTVTVVGPNANETTVPVGSNPSAIAVDPLTNQIYVVNSGAGLSPGTVTVIDGATNNTLSLGVGVSPTVWQSTR